MSVSLHLDFERRGWLVIALASYSGRRGFEFPPEDPIRISKGILVLVFFNLSGKFQDNKPTINSVLILSFYYSALHYTAEITSFNKLTCIVIRSAESQGINLTLMEPRGSLQCLQVLAVSIYLKLDDSNPLPVTFGYILILSYPLHFRSYTWSSLSLSIILMYYSYIPCVLSCVLNAPAIISSVIFSP
jgi:hypothetical protein